jgi:hypothetical protein
MNDNPVQIAIVGTESTAGGGVAPTRTGTIAETPGNQPNLLINVVGPIVAVAVRAANTFLETSLSVATLAGLGTKVFAAGDFHTVFMASVIAGATAAGLATVKNLITIFGRLEGKYPLLTGSI